jgi:hypothetical protein
VAAVGEGNAPLFYGIDHQFPGPATRDMFTARIVWPGNLLKRSRALDVVLPKESFTQLPCRRR